MPQMITAVATVARLVLILALWAVDYLNLESMIVTLVLVAAIKTVWFRVVSRNLIEQPDDHVKNLVERLFNTPYLSCLAPFSPPSKARLRYFSQAFLAVCRQQPRWCSGTDSNGAFLRECV